MRLHAKAFPSSSYMFASAANGGFCIDWTVLKAELSMKLTMHPLVQVADIFRPGRMTVCLTSAAASSAHLSMPAPKGYTALGSSVQRLPGGATAVVHSLLLPKLGSVLTNEPDLAGQAMSEVRAHSAFCRCVPAIVTPIVGRLQA